MAHAGDNLEALKAGNELAEQKLRAMELKMRAAALRRIGKAAAHPPSRGQQYTTSTRTRLRPGPRATGGSADKHLSAGVRGNLRRDCQDLERNSSTARIVIHRAQELIAGDGPIVLATTDDKEWNTRADRLWNLYADAADPDLVGHVDLRRQMSYAEILAGVISAWCTDGDQLVVRTNKGALQVIESERLVTPGSPYGGITRRTASGTIITQGVETDAAGAPVAYHVGDWNEFGALSSAPPRRVLAANADLLINPIGTKTGLTRGEPALQAVCERIERLDSYDQKVAVAAEVATLFAGIVRTKDPAGMQSLWESGAEQPTKVNANAPNVIDIEPGALHFFDQADSVTALKPEFPTTNFREYVTWHMMIVSAELGLPLVATMFDSAGLSWSNIKALLNMSLRSLEPAQSRLARLTRRVRAWKMREWMAEGLLPARDDYDACHVIFPRAPVVDFKSEVEGYTLAINNRLMTREQACQALGTGTFTSVAETAGAEEALLADLNIPAINAPGANAPVANAPATNAGPAHQPAADQTGNDQTGQPAGAVA